MASFSTSFKKSCTVTELPDCEPETLDDLSDVRNTARVCSARCCCFSALDQRKPITTANVINPTTAMHPAATATRLRRTNFPMRYRVPGGPAKTASPSRYRRKSAASPLALSYRRVRSFSRQRMVIQSRSRLSNFSRDPNSILRAFVMDLRSSMDDFANRALGRGGSVSMMVRCK